MRSLRIAGLHVTISNTKILSVQNSTTMANLFLDDIFDKFGFSQQMCKKVPNIKLEGSPSSESLADTLGERDGSKSHLWRLCEL